MVMRLQYAVLLQINGEGVGGKIFTLPIAMNWSHKSFEM